jgi:hypothetical protein
MAGGAVGGGFEIVVAEAAIAAVGDAHPVAQFGEIGDQGFIVGFVNFGAGGHLEHDVVRIGPGAQTPHAMTCCPHLEVLLVAIVNQGVKTIHRFNPYVAAIAAVAAIGTAHFNEFFAPERHGAGSAITGAHINFCFIKKFHGAL